MRTELPPPTDTLAHHAESATIERTRGEQAPPAPLTFPPYTITPTMGSIQRAVLPDDPLYRNAALLDNPGSNSA